MKDLVTVLNLKAGEEVKFIDGSKNDLVYVQ